jgi:acetyl esterase/lipase
MAFASALTALLLLGNDVASAQLAPRRLPAQDLPVPATVSPELQKQIAESATFAWPVRLPASNAGWDAMSDTDPAGTAAGIDDQLARLGLTLREQRIAGVRCYVIAPRRLAAPNAKRLLVHIHGGGYTMSPGKSGIREAILVAAASGIPAISIDYRMAPDHPFPAPTDDAWAVWKAVTAAHPDKRIGLFGTSTGGAMVLATVQRAVTERVRTSDAVVAGTPWSDLSETGDSYFIARNIDPWNYPGILGTMARQYAAGMDMKDPRLSPVYGSFSGFPPTLLLSGTRDIFLSNTVRVDRRLRDAGRTSELIVYEGQSHARYLAGPDVPESRQAMRDIAGFWSRHLGR